MKFGLENISKLCAELDHPERSFHSVIVAGTNGKGSVTAMVHRGLLAAGHRAARYTSPHLERLEERFVIGPHEVATAELEAAAAAVRGAVEALVQRGALECPPTFFECVTAAAFVLFRKGGTEVAVLEVGLGGRLDATNVVSPVAAAITSIALDHQQQLGETIEAVAFEKAGVIKPGIPVVIGELPQEAERVVRRACTERRARPVRARECVDLHALTGGQPLALRGAHQKGNAEVAACLLKQLAPCGLVVGDGAIRTAVLDVDWPGRLEVRKDGDVEILLDAAHNPAGARALARYLLDEEWNGCTAVFGAMQDKDVRGMLLELAPVCGALVCTRAPSPRAMPPDAIAAVARSFQSCTWAVRSIPDPAAALTDAMRPGSRVVLCGSIFLIGLLRGILPGR